MRHSRRDHSIVGTLLVRRWRHGASVPMNPARIGAGSAAPAEPFGRRPVWSDGRVNGDDQHDLARGVPVGPSATPRTPLPCLPVQPVLIRNADTDAAPREHGQGGPTFGAGTLR